jgi:DNA-binding beta-propeller fold protein YncE
MLRRIHECVCALAITIGAFSSASFGQFNNQHMVVANRAGGSISIIDVATNGVTNVPLPAGANTPEPMYVTYSPANDVLFVGDRANSRVVAFNARTYAVVNPGITVPAGLFHMEGSAATNRLWVVSDTSKQVSVINMLAFANLGSTNTPNDLGPNAAPHDIIVEPNGSAAYVTILGTSSATNDNVVKYSNAPGFPEVDRTVAGKGAHVNLGPLNNHLYLPSGAGVDIVSRSTLDPSAPSIAITNAHGIIPSSDGQTLYVTSFPGTGVNGLHAIDLATNTLLDSVDTPTGPHNVAVSSDDTRLYITHSGGASTLVSVFDISGANRTSPLFLTTVNAGLNPFGLGAVPAIPEPGGIALLFAGGALLRRRRVQ